MCEYAEGIQPHRQSVKLPMRIIPRNPLSPETHNQKFITQKTLTESPLTMDSSPDIITRLKPHRKALFCRIYTATEMAVNYLIVMLMIFYFHFDRPTNEPRRESCHWCP